MKKILASMLVGFVLLYSTGCAVLAPFSTYNHNRIKEQEIGKQIAARGSAEQIKAMNAGIKPSSVIKIIPTTDARGAYVAMDWWNPDNWTYFKTYAEAPVSSTAALLGDGGLWAGLIYLGGKLVDGSNNKQETNISVGSGSGTSAINVNSSGNKTGIENNGNNGGTTVINVNSDNNNTSVNNNPPPESP